jgi:hypothetical protein
MNNIVLEYLIASNELVIRFIKKINSTKYFYSIYGNANFNLKGIFDVSNDMIQHIPRITIDVEENTIFFIKFKNIVNEKIIEEFKFVELEKLKEYQNQKQNLSMNILDKKTANLFMSINMDEEGSDSDNDSEKSGSGNDNHSDKSGSGSDKSGSGSDNDSDTSYSGNIELLATNDNLFNEQHNIR